jgi:ABC-type uncharacterized transport system permease subunit
MAQSKLEAEGIIVFLKDELTVQSHNFLSNAVGGVKLQVLVSDIDEAQMILESIGIKIPDNNQEESGMLKWSEKYLDQLPYFKKWPTEVKLIFYVAIIMAFIALIVFSMTDFS